METPKLNPEELKNLDGIINYMQENNIPVLLGFIDSIGHFFSNAAHDVSHALSSAGKSAISVVSNITRAVTDAGHGNITGALKHVAQTGPSLISTLSQVATASAAQAATNDDMIQQLIGKLSADPQNKNGLTLEQLVAVRNQNSGK